MGLFDNLHRYRASESRTPTEDFLSEVLTEWFRLVSAAGLLRSVLTKCLGLEENCLPQHEDGRGVSWQTQHVIGPGFGSSSGKRPDIVAEGENFLLIVENKIWASLTGYEDTQGTAVSQLELYKQYRDARNQRFGGLVLLTHYTLAPPGYRQVTWREFHTRLVQWVETEGSGREETALHYWTKNFIAFLEEQQMAGTKIDLSDIVVGPAYRRLEKCLEGLGGVARVVMGRVVGNEWNGLRQVGSSGSFKAPQFYGQKLVNGADTDRSNMILWCGIQSGDVYEISPETNEYPELSVGLGVWSERKSGDFDVKAIVQKLQEHMECVEWKPQNGRSGYGILIVSVRQSLIDLHVQAKGGILDEAAALFFEKALKHLQEVLSSHWDEITALRQALPEETAADA